MYLIMREFLMCKDLKVIFIFIMAKIELPKRNEEIIK